MCVDINEYIADALI